MYNSAQEWTLSEREKLEADIRSQQYIIQDAQARLQHLLAKKKAMAAVESMEG